MVRYLKLQKKPAFLCNSRKSRANGLSLCHVTKTAKMNPIFYGVRFAVPQYSIRMFIYPVGLVFVGGIA
jgi:hypothetical protein